jgi:hypothetical protein
VVDFSSLKVLVMVGCKGQTKYSEFKVQGSRFKVKIEGGRLAIDQGQENFRHFAIIYSFPHSLPSRLLAPLH